MIGVSPIEACKNFCGKDLSAGFIGITGSIGSTVAPFH